MKLLNLALSTVLLTSMSAFAGGVSGGGGNVVACYKDGQLDTVELLDLYEARAWGKTIATLPGAQEEALLLLAKKLYPNAKQETIDHFLLLTSSVEQIMRKIPSGSKLELTNDAFPVFLPKNCKIEQVANYYNYSVIWYDPELYEKMDYTNRIALIVHEAVYATERETGVSDSRYSRRIIAELFSTDDNFVATGDGYTHFCSGPETKNRTIFLAKPLSQEKNGWEFSFQLLNGHHIYSKKTAQVILANSQLSQLDREDVTLFLTTMLESKIDSNETLSVKSNLSEISLSWKGTDPGDSFNNLKVTCYPRN